MASPILPDNAADQLSQLQLSSAVRPLTTFTVFSELPMELRLKIWSYALPVHPRRIRRIIQVRARVSTTLKTKDYSRFTLEENRHVGFIRDVGMLRANWESREVYIRFFPNILRTEKQGLIRYRGIDIVYISNMDKLMTNQYVRTAIRDHRQLEHLLSTCRIVAFPTQCFYRHFHQNSLPVIPLHGYTDIIARFSNLIGLGAVLDFEQHGFVNASRSDRDDVRRGWWCHLATMEMAWAKHGLWHWKDVPSLALVTTDGYIHKGKKCTSTKCYRNG